MMLDAVLEKCFWEMETIEKTFLKDWERYFDGTDPA